MAEQQAEKPKSFWEKYLTLLVFLLAITLIILIGLAGGWNLENRWLGILVVMILFVGVSGLLKTSRTETGARNKTIFKWGRVDGIFIDSRNRISLSTFQIVLWTLLALSAWATLVLHRTIPIIKDFSRELRVEVIEKLGEESEEGKVEPAMIEIVSGFMKGFAIDNRKLKPAEIKALITRLSADDQFTQSTSSIPDYDPLNVSFPQELLLVMGISTASLAGSTIIKIRKSSQDSGSTIDTFNRQLGSAINRRDVSRSSESVETMRSEIQENVRDRKSLAPDQRAFLMADQKVTDLEKVDQDRAGVLHQHEKMEDAAWTDMLSGDKITDFQYLDITKVQMFLFTIILVFSYAVLLWGLMSENGAEYLLYILPTVSLPAFSTSMVALLGLSHAGYLTGKGTG